MVAILDGERVLTQIFESGKTKDNPSQVWFGWETFDPNETKLDLGGLWVIHF
jgi:hypothetical protein